jgi:Tfp pilus assembly protein PilF
MKLIYRFFLIVLLSANIFNPAFSQKILNKLADRTCDCINDKINNFKGDNQELFQNCLMQAFMDNIKQLEKEYGKGFMTTNKEEVEAVGIKVGKLLVSRCQTFLNLFVDQAAVRRLETDSLRAVAGLKMDSGYYNEAIPLFTRIIQNSPNNYEAYNSRGYCYYYNGDIYRAIADYIKATDLNPSLAKAYSNMALAKYTLFDLAGAMNDVNQAILLDPSLAVAYNNRGLIYYKNEQYDSAFYDFNKAVKLAPSQALYNFNAGIALSEIQEDSLALVYYNRAMSLNYINADIYNRIGTSLYRLNRYKEAADSYTMCIEADSTIAKFYENRALAYEGLRQYDKALVDLNATIRMGNSGCAIYAKRGTILMRLGKKTEACGDFRKAKDLNCKESSSLIETYCK